jgi:hypothetical protein
MSPPSNIQAPRLALIVCDVFAKELALATAGAGHIVTTETLPIALHDHTDKMRADLQRVISAWETRDDIEAIALVYGLCGCGTTGLVSSRHRLVIPRAHDCRAVLLGDRALFEQRAAACPGCYYYSPGWNLARRVPGPEREEMLRADLLARFDPEDVDFLMESEAETWRAYDTAAYIDHGTEGSEAEAAYTETCARHLGWRYERVKGDISWLRDLVWGNWDDYRFQIIEPGQRMVHAPDERIMRAEPAAAPVEP